MNAGAIRRAEAAADRAATRAAERLAARLAADGSGTSRSGRKVVIEGAGAVPPWPAGAMR